MPWYGQGIMLLGRTAVEWTRVEAHILIAFFRLLLVDLSEAQIQSRGY